VKREPPPKAHDPPTEAVIIYDDSPTPGANDYLVDPQYPIAPMKMTSMGTSTPRPIKSGLRTASLIPTRVLQIANTTAMTVQLVENT
jgi:hypothetical protein